MTTPPNRWAIALTRSIPPAVAAAALWILGRRTGAALAAALALALVVASVASPAAGEYLDRLVARAASAAAAALSHALAALAWLLALLPLWCLTRMSNALRRTRRRPKPSSAWLQTPPGGMRQPDGSPLDPSRSGSMDTPANSGSRAFTLIGIAALTALLTASLVMIGRRTGIETALTKSASTETATKLDDTADTPDTPDNGAVEWDGLPVDDYAHEGEPWAKDHIRELNELPTVSDPFIGYRLIDFEGRHINIADGRRVSYSPADPEITVWFFGGSTMFGIGQRDGHTLPSVIARAAEADGIGIRAVNFGVSGFVNWQSIEQFEQALSSGMEPPDLAVFYEGINEWSLGNERADLGDLREGSISRLGLKDEDREKVRSAPDHTDPLPQNQARARSVVALAADQYRRGSELVDALAKSYDVPVARAWQPSPFAKRPNPSDERLWDRLDFDPAWLPTTTQQYNEIRIGSGVDVIDLTTVLDDVDRPIYFDGGHTNEMGARIIGEALYRALLPQLEDLAGR